MSPSPCLCISLRFSHKFQHNGVIFSLLNFEPKFPVKNLKFLEKNDLLLPEKISKNNLWKQNKVVFFKFNFNGKSSTVIDVSAYPGKKLMRSIVRKYFLFTM